MGKPGDIQRFIGGTQDKGVNTFEPDIGAEITWDESTVNVTSGIRRGVGPRFGTAPIPGHADTETVSGTRTNGLMASEAASGGQGLVGRELVFGVIPLNITEYDGAYPKKNRRFYAWLVGLDDTSNVSLDVCLGSTLTGAIFKQSADIRAGLMASSYKGESPLVRRHKTELLNLPTITTAVAADVAAILRAVPSQYWIPSAHISVSGKRIPYFNMVCDNTTTPATTTAPELCVWQVNLTSPTLNVFGGAPSESITREDVLNVARTISIYCFDTTGQPMDMKYTKEITAANVVAVQQYGTTATYITLTGATRTGANVTYSSVRGALLNDPSSYTNSRHDAVLFAGEIPVAVVYQDWLQSASGMKPRYIDLTQPACFPRLLSTIIDAGNSYPSSLPVNPNVPSTRGANGSGVFLLDIYYDIGFSYYNKQLDYEGNVVFAFPFINQDATKPLGVYFTFNSGATNNSAYEYMRADAQGDHALPWEYSDVAATAVAGTEVPRQFNINDYQIRWYFREKGTGEWLPAEAYDAAEWWFYPYGATGPKLGQSPQGRAIGGQAGGFVDYSPLPKQRYICTLVYKGRAFWFSEKSMQFSLVNNVYAYPTRNGFNIPTGLCRGGIIHIQPGETIQTSRLVVFGSDQSYVGRFTGFKAQQQVRVSYDTIGQFDVDGSDFEIDYLCEATAYSFRAACVAEGILYFWGPQGVYRDDGISKPEKITQQLEQEIFDYVDAARISEVHAVYNKRTKEIIWFYPPKVADAAFPTYGLVLNIANGNFYPMKFAMQIDSAQVLKLEEDSTPDGIDGERILIHGRDTAAATISRSFFFDELCQAGDQGPTRELLIKTVATPSAGIRRLTPAAGSLAVTALAVGDYIAIQNVEGYVPSVTATVDFIAKIVAVGAADFDIALPAGVTLADAVLTAPTMFPAYHGGTLASGDPGEHGITYQVKTNYWLPTGVADSWLWRYIYKIFKVSLWPAPVFPAGSLAGKLVGAVYTFAHRTLVCEGETTDDVGLTNNSDGHCQVHHPLGNEGVAAAGQALKYRLSGVHIGHKWTLEYLEAHCTAEQGFTLKEFEG